MPSGLLSRPPSLLRRAGQRAGIRVFWRCKVSDGCELIAPCACGLSRSFGASESDAGCVVVAAAARGAHQVSGHADDGVRAHAALKLANKSPCERAASARRHIIKHHHARSNRTALSLGTRSTRTHLYGCSPRTESFRASKPIEPATCMRRFLTRRRRFGGTCNPISLMKARGSRSGTRLAACMSGKSIE